MIIAEAVNALVLLAIVACPIGMGLMMWFMARGMRGGMHHGRASGEDRPLAALRAEQARLAEKIERLEVRGGAAEEQPADEDVPAERTG